MTIYDALVIGAGPAGSTAALLLARRGWSVAIAEKVPFPRRKVCGEYISATTWPILRELGVADSFVDGAGPPVRRVGLFAGDIAICAQMPAPQRAFAQWGLALGRESLDTVLLERAARAGAECWQPWSVAALQTTSEGHVARLVEAGSRATLEIGARVVIAAHGSWERGALPTQAPRAAPRDGDLLGFKAHFTGAHLAAGLMPLLLFPGGYGGMVHSDAGRTSFSCCIRRDALARARRERPRAVAGEAVIAHILSSCRGVREALSGAVLEGAWLSAGPIRPGIRTLARGGIFGVGNAAGEAHPLIAEGISMAIQSSWILCERLGAQPAAALTGAAIDAIGRDYARRWRRHFAPRLAAAALFAGLMTRPATAALSAAILGHAPALLSWGARFSGKAHALRIARPDRA
jgi:flavin-dependent dehydrogenase